jgi:hypothetical protein
MKNTNEVKQNVKEKEGQFAAEQKVSSCCGPTCCGGASDTKNKDRKEK